MKIWLGFFQLCCMIFISRPPPGLVARPMEFSKQVETSKVSMIYRTTKSRCMGGLESNLVSNERDTTTPSLFYTEPDLSHGFGETDPSIKSPVTLKSIRSTFLGQENKLRQITASLSTSSMMDYLCKKSWRDTPGSSCHVTSLAKTQNSGPKTSPQSGIAWPRRVKSSVCFCSQQSSSVFPSELLEAKSRVNKLEAGPVFLDKNHKEIVDKGTNTQAETRKRSLNFDAPLEDLQQMAKEYGFKSHLSIKLAIGITELSWNMIQHGIETPEWEKTLPKIYAKPFFLLKRHYDLKVKRFNDMTILWEEDYKKYGLKDILQEYSNGMGQALLIGRDQAVKIGYERFMNYLIPRLLKLHRLLGSQERVLEKICQNIHHELQRCSI